MRELAPLAIVAVIGVTLAACGHIADPVADPEGVAICGVAAGAGAPSASIGTRARDGTLRPSTSAAAASCPAPSSAINLLSAILSKLGQGGPQEVPPYPIEDFNTPEDHDRFVIEIENLLAIFQNEEADVYCPALASLRSRLGVFLKVNSRGFANMSSDLADVSEQAECGLKRLGIDHDLGDWVSDPTVFNDPPETDLVCSGDDVNPTCFEVTTRRSGITGGTHGFDADGDGLFEAVLTAEVELLSEVRDLSDGTFQYSWTVENLGTGAVTGVQCGPNGPALAISTTNPLLGTAGVDRLPGTGDDLASGETLDQTQESPTAPGAVACNPILNPTTPRVLELLVPLPASPTTHEQCVDGGWRDFGFENQGLCIQFVETGKDRQVGA